MVFHWGNNSVQSIDLNKLPGNRVGPKVWAWQLVLFPALSDFISFGSGQFYKSQEGPNPFLEQALHGRMLIFLLVCLQ